jgi:hypothetical protein
MSSEPLQGKLNRQDAKVAKEEEESRTEKKEFFSLLLSSSSLLLGALGVLAVQFFSSRVRP